MDRETLGATEAAIIAGMAAADAPMDYHQIGLIPAIRTVPLFDVRAAMQRLQQAGLVERGGPPFHAYILTAEGRAQGAPE